MNLDEAEQQMNDMIRSGTAKLLECKVLDDETLEGKSMKVVSSRTELPGAPASPLAKLYIGKSDGLPYQQVSEQMKTTYRYDGVSAPK